MPAIAQLRKSGDTIRMLSPRQCQIVKLLTEEALQDKEIAYRLGITPGTVRVYLHAIYRKLGINSRVELMRWWYTSMGYSRGS